MRNLVCAFSILLACGCGEDRDKTVVFDPDYRPEQPLGGGTTLIPAADAGPSPDASGLGAVPDAAGLFALPTGLKGLPSRLISGGDRPFDDAPQWLSEVGVFRDLAQLEPSASLVSYTVQAPLFSDRSIKSRWLALPEGTTIGYQGLDAWEFPEGTVFIKQFDMVLDEREPQVQSRLETRLLVAGEAGEFYGLTYRWNEEATDAQVVLESTTIELSVTDAAGQVSQQSYFLPGPQDCMACHDSRAGWVLGVRSLQLHSATTVEQLPNDSLMQLSEQGLFDRKLSNEDVLDLPSLARLNDESRSVEDRVRSYLDSNCAHCHGPREGFFIPLDARYGTPLAEQGIVWGAAANPKGGLGSLLVVPGSWETSEIYLRDASLDLGVKMPPLGRNVEDETYLALLRQWIVSLQGDERFPAP